ncbi:unnamed protein product [Clonostachys chloroleuca]|uniref:Uncharacterized protein n=1 Tax=Clonostachys chloroleuca TaxID=1926264 RepID=A0AA35MF50_9HYPO|nr:unnamed protein product [Clonostachys chloroleuca]
MYVNDVKPITALASAPSQTRCLGQGPTALHADLPARASQLCEIERQGHLEICMRIMCDVYPAKRNSRLCTPRLISYFELQLDNKIKP